MSPRPRHANARRWLPVLTLTAWTACCAPLAGCGDDTTGAQPPPDASLPDGGTDDVADPRRPPEDGQEPPQAGNAGAPADPPGSRVDAGPTDAHPDPDGGTADLAHPVSEFCGDGIRDPVTEECDDGTALEDPCSADCRVREAALLAPTTPPQASLERLRGHGPHNMASHGESSIAVVYVERTSSSAVHAQFLDGWGGRTADPVELSAGGSPTTEPNPVVAPLPGDRYAFAWTDAASGTPDILLQSAPAGAPPTSSPQLAHETSSGPQQDPDMLWVGDELIVTWSALLDVHYRRFDAQLRPLGPSQPLAATADIDSFPTLARFGDTWAAAFRVVSDGLQSVRVQTEAATWTTPPHPPSPVDEPPALLALDATTLLVAFTIGTDPTDSGTANTPRVRVAMLSTTDPDPSTDAPLELVDASPAAATLRQRAPTLTRIDDQIFVAWQQATLPEDLRSEEVVAFRFAALRAGELPNPTASLAPLATPSPGLRDQRNPALAATELFPGGALLLLWEDHGPAAGAAPSPDLKLLLRPSPFVTLPGG